jgi:hypothetical protein
LGVDTVIAKGRKREKQPDFMNSLHFHPLGRPVAGGVQKLLLFFAPFALSRFREKK